MSRPTYVLLVLVAVAATMLTSGFGCRAGKADGETEATATVHWPRSSVPETIIVPPLRGALYHGVFPGGVTGEEDDFTESDVASYETSVGHQVAWVYFSNNWYKSRAFPLAMVTMIRARGSVPYVRLMLRQSDEQNLRERIFTLDRISRGYFDANLRAWARGARAFGTPLMVEWGTEMNGRWFSWNGYWNGGGRTTGFGNPRKADGPERFRAAYRHIVNVMRAQGADNVVWVFHVNSDDWPATSWNRFENYYPGYAYVDWLAVSAYGTQSPTETEADSFRTMMDSAYPRLAALGPGKPIIVAEFGTDGRNPSVEATGWVAAALDDMIARRWPRLVGFSWWNEHWQNDEDPAHDTIMRLQELPNVCATFRGRLDANTSSLALRPIFGRRR